MRPERRRWFRARGFGVHAKKRERYRRISRRAGTRVYTLGRVSSPFSRPKPLRKTHTMPLADCRGGARAAGSPAPVCRGHTRPRLPVPRRAGAGLPGAVAPPFARRTAHRRRAPLPGSAVFRHILTAFQGQSRPLIPLETIQAPLGVRVFSLRHPLPPPPPPSVARRFPRRRRFARPSPRRGSPWVPAPSAPVPVFPPVGSPAPPSPSGAGFSQRFRARSYDFRNIRQFSPFFP